MRVSFVQQPVCERASRLSALCQNTLTAHRPRSTKVLGTGLIVAEEVFGRRVPPLVCLDRESFLSLSTAPFASVAGDAVATGATEREAEERLGTRSPSRPDDLLAGLELTSEERVMLGLTGGAVAGERDGRHGGRDDEQRTAAAHRLAMRIVARAAALQGATRLLPIESAHIDAV